MTSPANPPDLIDAKAAHLMLLKQAQLLDMGSGGNFKLLEPLADS